MSKTPITDKAWDEIPHYVMSFGRATRMREACREMERQRNELLEALEYCVDWFCDDVPIGRLEKFKATITKAKGATP